MKKILCCIFVLCLAFVCKAQDTVAYVEYWANGNKATEGYKTKKDALKTGKWTYYYNDGKSIERQGEYNDKGWKIGVWQWFYKNGKLKKQETFTGNGENKAYYDNGQLYYSCQVIDGKKEGEYKEYHKSGNIKLQATYKDDEFEGLATWWYDNGYKDMCGTISHGKKNGKWEYFYMDNGKKESEGSYINDKENRILLRDYRSIPIENSNREKQIYH